jgi:hypothetical protein
MKFVLVYLTLSMVHGAKIDFPPDAIVFRSLTACTEAAHKRQPVMIPTNGSKIPTWVCLPEGNYPFDILWPLQPN